MQLSENEITVVLRCLAPKAVPLPAIERTILKKPRSLKVCVAPLKISCYFEMNLGIWNWWLESSKSDLEELVSSPSPQWWKWTCGTEEFCQWSISHFLFCFSSLPDLNNKYEGLGWKYNHFPEEWYLVFQTGCILQDLCGNCFVSCLYHLRFWLSEQELMSIHIMTAYMNSVQGWAQRQCKRFMQF